MFRILPQARVSTQLFRKAVNQRPHHTATARLITMSPQGTPITRQIKIWLGDLGSAYVMFDPEFSQAFQTDSTLQGGDSTTQDPELIPLEFHHDTRHFARKSSPYPRLEIPQDLLGDQMPRATAQRLFIRGA
ncbi:hypothetical protein V499_06560 [Pseudogymnoascus sp. VKM F-103]|nr:hypothetical protein V499_06560 [Pseudogymnoascus sp. VKM F-103]